MYTRAQLRKLRNRTDHIWKVEDKVEIYKGLVKIFNRERRKELNKANETRRQQARNICELRKDIHYFRSYLSNCMFGSKQRMRVALQERTLQLMFQHNSPQQAIEYFEHANNRYKRQHDYLKYRINGRMKTYQKLRLERATLQDRLETGFENKRVRHTIQMLTNKIQTFVVKQNAATEVYALYRSMVDLLEKDGHYLDAILSVLHSDCEEQCKCVLRAAELGQLAQDELLDIQNEFKWLEREVRVNMKEREKQVRQFKKMAEELRYKCTAQTRQVSSVAPILSAHRASSSLMTVYRIEPREVEERSEEQDTMEDIIQRVQDATLAPTYKDIFPRMLYQVEQEERMLLQMSNMLKLRDMALHAKGHSEFILSALKHDVTESTTRFNLDRDRLQQEIEEEEYRRKCEEAAVNEHGHLLTGIREELHRMYETLYRVREESSVLRSESSSEVLSQDLLEMSPDQVERTFLPPMESNPGKQLEDIRTSLYALHVRARSITLDDVKLHDQQAARQNARQLQQWRSTRHELLEDVKLVEETEVEDMAIPSRCDIKVLSRQIVEKQERLMELQRQGLRPPGMFTALKAK